MHTPREALRRLAVGTLMPGFVGTTVPAWIEREYAAGLAAVCLYGANVVTRAAGPSCAGRCGGGAGRHRRGRRGGR